MIINSLNIKSISSIAQVDRIINDFIKGKSIYRELIICANRITILYLSEI